MARIYISSTFQDLKDFREEVSRALRRLGHEDVAMEYYVAGDERPLDKCLNDVASCKLYVGIFAWRYGYIPHENNPDGRSITELEYRKAQENSIPCLIFLLSEETPWPRNMQDTGEIVNRIENLRQELCARHSVNFFGSKDELTRKVNEAVLHWEKESGIAGKRQLTDWDAYRQAIINKHQWVRLQVIAGASKDRGPLRIPLIEVFEPQLVAPGASGTDIPDEVRKYQEIIYGMRSQETDDDLTKEDLPDIAGEMVEQETEELLLSSNPELVLDMLGREPTQVILGGPGSGKSTILQYAMIKVCQANNVHESLPTHLKKAPIPFLIELRNYVQQDTPDFVSYIVVNSKAFYDVIVDSESLVKVLKQEGQALVFFDGLDEVFDPDDRKRMINQFQNFANRYPGVRIVVTSRIAGYDRTSLGLAGFEHYTLLPLTLGQIRHFVGQWYQYYTLEGTERTAQGLVQRIIESPRLLDLAGNPLLLTMMAVIYKDRDLPSERWRLYQRCAETLLEDWELGKGIEVEDFKLAVLIRTAQKSEILQQVSMYMLEHAQQGRELNAIAYDPLYDIVSTYLESKYQLSRGKAEAASVDILRHLMEHTYVLAGIGERVFGFVHRTFMEYFAACQCLAQFNARKSDFPWLTRDIFGKHWQGGDWDEVLLLLIAMLHDQGTPIQEVVEYLRNECKTTIPFNVAFAARCLGEAGDVQEPARAQELLVELTQAIVEYAHQTRKTEAKTFVEAALGAFAALAPLVVAPKTVKKAITKLEKGENVAARMAAWQMGFALRLHKERLNYALDALKDNEEAVRRGAIAALEREWPGRADIAQALTDVVRTDRQSRVRQAALDAMQRSWRYEPAILDAIESRVDEETAYTYVIRLIEYLATTWRGNPKARDLILKLAGPKPKARYEYDYASVAKAAGRALAQGWGSEAQTLDFLQDRATNEPDPQIRTNWLQAIAEGWSGDTQVLDFLQGRTTNEPNSATRATVFRAIALGWSNNAQVLDFLQNRATDDPEPQIRETVLQAIAEGWSGDDQVLDFLQDRAIHDSSLEIRETVLKAIADSWSGDDQVLAFLRDRATNESEPQIRATILQAIAEGWGGDDRALNFLQDSVTNEPDPDIRDTVFKAIAEGWGGDDRVFVFLQDRAINDSDAQTRATVLQAIAEFWDEDDQVLDFLQDRAANDPELQTKTVAFQAIAYGWSGNDRALEFLQNIAATDPDAQTRAVVLEVIMNGWNGNDQALPFLQDRATNDPELQTRAVAFQAIAQGWSENVKALDFLMDCATNALEPETRIAVLQAIPMMTRYYSWYGGLQEGESNRETILAFLRERGVNEPNIAVRKSAIWSFVESFQYYYWFSFDKPFSQLPYLLDLATNDPEVEIRVTAFYAIGGIDPDSLRKETHALTFLQEQAKNHSKPDTRKEALWAIAYGWNGDSQVLDFLQNRAVNDPEPATRAVAFQAIAHGWVNNAQVLDFLQNRAIIEPEVETRAIAFQTIAQSWNDDSHVLDFLIDQASNSPEPQIRATVFQSIAEAWSDDDQVWDLLQDRVVNDQTPQVRASIFRAIADWGDDPQTLNFLKACALNDPDETNRSGFHEILRQLRDGSFWDY